MNPIIVAGACAATFSATVLGLIQVSRRAKWRQKPDLTPTRLRNGEPLVPCVLLVKPGKNHPFLCNAKLDEVAPLYGMPRAWQADGTPPQGDWEDDYTDSDGITLTTGEDLNVGPHQEVRRWIGDWEEITK